LKSSGNFFQLRLLANIQISAMVFDVEEARKQFPGLKQPQVYFDNAGGSQTLGTVIKS